MVTCSHLSRTAPAPRPLNSSPEDFPSGMSMPWAFLEDVSSGPTRSLVSCSSSGSSVLDTTCSSRGRSTPIPPTQLTTSWGREGTGFAGW